MGITMARKWLIVFIVSVTALMSLAEMPTFGQDSIRQSWLAPKLLGPGWWQSLALDQQNNLWSVIVFYP